MSLMACTAGVGTAYSTQVQEYNTCRCEQDPNNAGYGVQYFVFKKVFDAGVATSIGSPVGSTQASGGNIVTPDQSDASSGGGIRGISGGVAQVAVAANTNRFQFIQYAGIGRVALQTTGALAAGALGVWSGDDTVAAFTDPGNEELIFVHALVAASGGTCAAGGYVIF